MTNCNGMLLHTRTKSYIKGLFMLHSGHVRLIFAEELVMKFKAHICIVYLNNCMFNAECTISNCCSY